MTPHTTWRTAIAVATALALLLAGCGDDGDDGSAPTTEAGDETTTTAAEEPTTTAAPSDEEVQAVVDGVDITLDDLSAQGEGWVVDDAGEEGDDGADDDFDECFGTASDLETRAESDGASFGRDGEVISYAATGTMLFTTEADAVATMDAASTEEFRVCAESLVLEDLGPGTLESYPGGTRYGDQWVVLGAVVEVEGGGDLTLPVQVDLQLLRTGPLVTFLVFFDTGGGEAAAAVVDALLQALERRQAEAAPQLA